MSERYQTCRRCNGRGWIPLEINLVGQVDPDEPTLPTRDECPRCDGTGWTGDALEPRDR